MRIIQSETKNHWSTAVTLSNVCPYWNNWYAKPFFKPFWKDQTLKAMCHVLLRECPQLGMPPKTKRKSLSTKAGFPQSPWADRERLRQHFHSSFGADQNGGETDLRWVKLGKQGVDVNIPLKFHYVKVFFLFRRLKVCCSTYLGS